MKTIKDGGTAFPVSDTVYPSGAIQHGSNGMSLRAWLAGQALNGIASNQSQLDGQQERAIRFGVTIETMTAKTAVKMADALLAELEVGTDSKDMKETT